MLIALSGLPGTGKTTIARLLAARLRAVHVRIDTIEQALLRAGHPPPLGAEGYAVAYGLAADNLRLGHRVIADCVNALQLSRDAWQKVAQDCEAAYLAVHLVCGDADEHRRRVAHRQADIEGHVLPTWEQVSASRFDPPPPGVLTIDTCGCSAEGAVDLIMRRANAAPV
jgi:predicted kinase